MSPLFQVKKVSDEGTSSPFTARILIGLLEFRDQLYLLSVKDQDRRQRRDRFDRKLVPLFEGAQAS
jgi:hypothetical protein